MTDSAANAALVVVDMQNDFCHPDGALAQAGKDVERLASVAPAIEMLVERAKTIGMLTVFTRQINHRRDSNAPEWVDLLERVVGLYDFTLRGTWGSELFISDDLRTDCVVLEKSRSDAFVRTPFESLLRDREIRSLYVCGVVTEGCVLCTALSASCRDFDVTMVSDAVASGNCAAHEAALTIVSRRLRVVESHEILEMELTRSC